MPRLWFVLGLLSVILGALLYDWQEVFKHSHWDWSQFHTTEAAVSALLAAGIVLLLVAAVERITRK